MPGQRPWVVSLLVRLLRRAQVRSLRRTGPDLMGVAGKDGMYKEKR